LQSCKKERKPMSKQQWNREAFQECLSHFGVDIDSDVADKIADAFVEHLSMMSDMDSNGHDRGEHVCQKCESLKSKLSKAESEIEAYQNSVVKRHNGYAKYVRIENGDVVFDFVG